MSSHIVSGGDVDDSFHKIVQQLEEMHQVSLPWLKFVNLLVESMKLQGLYIVLQMLWRKFEHEKQKLQEKMGSGLRAFNPDQPVCAFSPNILCTQTGLDNWLSTLPFVDETSLSLDMWLLQELSKIVVFEEDDIEPVSYKFSL